MIRIQLFSTKIFALAKIKVKEAIHFMFEGKKLTASFFPMS